MPRSGWSILDVPTGRAQALEGAEATIRAVAQLVKKKAVGRQLQEAMATHIPMEVGWSTSEVGKGLLL